jgi:ribosomal-protein-alanine N-acetyltransferase
MKVILKKYDLADQEDVRNLCNEVDRNYISNRLPMPYTKDDAIWWINMANEHDGKDGIFRLIMADDKIVGNISVEQKSDVFEKDAEIGYLLANENWSKGIATEAVKQICKIAFSQLSIIRITGLVYGPNIASKRVLEKNDFVLEGTMKNAVNKNENIYDLCIYGKSKSADGIIQCT